MLTDDRMRRDRPVRMNRAGTGERPALAESAEWADGVLRTPGPGTVPVIRRGRRRLTPVDATLSRHDGPEPTEVR
jgi:hypothetical protein